MASNLLSTSNPSLRVCNKAFSEFSGLSSPSTPFARNDVVPLVSFQTNAVGGFGRNVLRCWYGRKDSIDDIGVGSMLFLNCRKHDTLIARANPDSNETSEKVENETYEVEVEQPYGLRFSKGRDGGVYINAIAPGLSADRTGKFSVGDRVIATSAVFGEEIWPAAEYGRTMYTIRQRIGPLYMKMQKGDGKMGEGGQLTEKEIIRAERNSGFISNRVREIQLQNYQRKMELKQNRERDLREGLQLYKTGKYEEAREKFESVLGSTPTPDEASVASYNVACCYSKLNQIQAGLSALEDALKEGYEDFKRVRTDPDLANLRKSEEFETLMKRFDESFINESAIKAITSLFGLFGKK